ncbi:MAG: PAS domain S-box protein, partial [Chloroflexi bacterium]
QESEEKYRTLIEQSTDAIFLIYGGRFELVNRRFTEMFGITPQEASAPDFVFTNILAPENKDAIAYLAPERAQARKHGPPYEFVAIDKEGHRINVELTMSYPLYKRGLATQGIIRDISARKRAEEEKRVAYEKVQQYADELARKISEVQRQREIATILAEVVSSVSLTLSTDELLTHILIRLQQLVPYDAAAVYMAGDGDLVLEAVHGYRADFVNPQESIAENVLFQEMHTKKSYILVEDTGQDPHFQMLFGTENVRSWIGAPLLVAQEIMGYMAVERHVPGAYTTADAELVQAFAHQVAQTIHNARLFTELKETQAQLVQRERLAALGQMAATVAHELRNPLMSLRMGIEYLTFDLPDEDPKHRAATLVESNMDRIARVVENILFVARTPRLSRISGSLYQMVENELAQWEYKLAENQITLRADLADDLPEMFIDFDQMERVLSNLIGNAIDAMESGGTLSVVLKTKDDAQIFTVSDTGSGMSEETRAKIFEPFFTTKSRGTGLGLAIVKQIVESHGGQISVRSQEGQGTTFTVKLPQQTPG